MTIYLHPRCLAAAQAEAATNRGLGDMLAEGTQSTILTIDRVCEQCGDHIPSGDKALTMGAADDPTADSGTTPAGNTFTRDRSNSGSRWVYLQDETHLIGYIRNGWYVPNPDGGTTGPFDTFAAACNSRGW